MAIVGTIAGAAGVALGVAKIGAPMHDDNRTLAVVDLLFGVPSLILGTRALLSAPPRTVSSTNRFRVAPLATLGRSPRVGFSANLRF